MEPASKPLLVTLATTAEPYASIKRLLDVVLSVFALVVLAPLLLAIALSIWLTTGRPIFFHQARLGLAGRPFTLYKFRTMVPNADERLAQLRNVHLQAHPDDPIVKLPEEDELITPIGRILRTSSLDELPQFVNVLKGEMSLVGPRPPLPQEATVYTQHQARRLSVLPGLTGIWQVSGRSTVSFDRWMAMDLEYIDHRSIGLDLWILLRTIPAVLSRRGAR
jgi:lipopolysaccharide/colanic/teichoic acid biosynthesis glycosyltransferase